MEIPGSSRQQIILAPSVEPLFHRHRIAIAASICEGPSVKGLGIPGVRSRCEPSSCCRRWRWGQRAAATAARERDEVVTAGFFGNLKLEIAFNVATLHPVNYRVEGYQIAFNPIVNRV